MQRTIDDCGLLSEVPSTRLPDDLVLSEDGGDVRHGNAFYDCHGKAYCIADNRHDADVEAVTDLLNVVDKWVTDYSQTEDHASRYGVIVDETHTSWPLEQWLLDNDYDESVDDLAPLAEKLRLGLDSSDCELEYNSNEYAGHTGPGCCLFVTDNGEMEEQLCLEDYPELKRLHDEGRLDNVLDDVNCDVYVSRNKRWVKDEEPGLCKQVGRDTYDIYGHDNPCLNVYVVPGGRWAWVVPVERMIEILEA